METTWEKLQEEGVKIIADMKCYDESKDTRLLIPFIPRNNKLGQVNKIGLLAKNGAVVLEPLYDIILDDCYSFNKLIRVGKLFSYGYPRKNDAVSTYIRYKFKVINANGSFVLDQEFDGIVVSTDNQYITVRDREKGYAVYDRSGNEIVPFGRYNWIDGFDRGLSRVKVGKVTKGIANSDNKWGIININGEEVLSLEYTNIWNFYGKRRPTTIVEKGTKKEEINLLGLIQESPTALYNASSDDDYDFDRYGYYAGSYAQDVMGYSDDLIDDAFDGDPEAYWNID